jgi:hypothetical protein
MRVGAVALPLFIPHAPPLGFPKERKHATGTHPTTLLPALLPYNNFDILMVPGVPQCTHTTNTQRDMQVLT